MAGREKGAAFPQRLALSAWLRNISSLIGFHVPSVCDSSYRSSRSPKALPPASWCCPTRSRCGIGFQAAGHTLERELLSFLLSYFFPRHSVFGIWKEPTWTNKNAPECTLPFCVPSIRVEFKWSLRTGSDPNSSRRTCFCSTFLKSLSLK